MITIMADNKQIDVKWVEFSDGAITCKVDPIIKECSNYISLNVDPSTPCKQVVEEITLVLSALKCLEFDTINVRGHLNLDYLPYGRADRVFEAGNPEPLLEFLYTLDSFNFHQINFVDVHNPKLLGDLDTPYTNKSQLECFKESLSFDHKFNWTHVIAPDKGAKEKAKSIADWLKITCVEAEKKRDISTGRIIETTLDTELPVGSRVIIVDDILDGGGTYIPLAEKLRSHGCTVDLYVTHLIAAEGLDKFKGLIGNIYCYHTVGKYINRNDIMNFNLNK